MLRAGTSQDDSCMLSVKSMPGRDLYRMAIEERRREKSKRARWVWMRGDRLRQRSLLCLSVEEATYYEGVWTGLAVSHRRA
jgi:hypothetical protein